MPVTRSQARSSGGDVTIPEEQLPSTGQNEPIVEVETQSNQRSQAGSIKSDRARLRAQRQVEIARLRYELAVAEAAALEHNDAVSIASEEESEVKVQSWLDDNEKQETSAPSKKIVPDGNSINLSELASAIALAARSNQQVVPRYVVDLPVFCGSHHEWLTFKSAYEESFGHFSDVENTARLRRCLRGKAKEAVECLLIANVKPLEVVGALEKRFGRPDAIAIAELERLRSVPKTTDSPKEICVFANKIRNCVATLRILDRERYLHSPEVLKSLIEKLTPSLRYRWFDFVAEYNEEEPDLQKFDKFIDREAERCGKFAPPEQFTIEDAAPKGYRPGRTQKTFTANDDKKNCVICDKVWHRAIECQKWKSSSVSDRWALAKQCRLCFRCLRYRNASHKCANRKCSADNCEKFHHPTLHYVAGPEKEKGEVVATANPQGNQAYLKILPVKLTGPKGSVNTYALLDDGSTVTLVDANLASDIGAEGILDPLKISGIAGEKINSFESKRVTFQIKGKQNKHQELQARTIENLRLSPQTVIDKVLKLPHLKNIKRKLWHRNAVPKLLIGQDNWHLLTAESMRKGPINEPVASLTPLGWVLHGATSRSLGQKVHYVYHLHDQERDEAMQRYFALESLSVEPRTTRADPEKRALTILENNTIEKSSGGYETTLLWKNDNIVLPNNYESALKRLDTLERKIDRSPVLKQKYQEYIESLIKKGYAELAIKSATENRTWYLPHFAVLHPAKPDKIRIVFDAAARFRGQSLNDNLLTGPDLLQSLPGVLMRFRQYRVAVAADIQDMFLRVGIKEEDRDALRFLWRDDRREGAPREYRMKSLIFGAASSPCTALYIKDFNAEKHRHTHSDAAEAIIANHYVDDYLQSFVNVEDARRITSEVRDIHRKANFYLAKWTSNCEESIEMYKSESMTRDVILDKVEKILGLVWKPTSDVLGFHLDFAKTPGEIINGMRTPTKREALSTVMSIFDPLGLASPVTIQAKQLLQETWRLGVGWDDALPESLKDKWHTWVDDMKRLKEIEIPRCHPDFGSAMERELHTFVDASERAYAAAVFWKATDGNGNIQVSLAAAKARVAPLKLTSIPRLELQAAILGSRLSKTVIKEYQIKPEKRFYWTDSKTVLTWLRAGPRTFKPFVAHRVAEIEEDTKVNEWYWIPTQHNVADDATREIPRNFGNKHRWFIGPDFLYNPQEQWPVREFEKLDSTGEERVNIAKVTINLNDALPEITRFSCWKKLIRVTARVLQFVEILKLRVDSVNHKRTMRNSEKNPSWNKKKTLSTPINGKPAKLVKATSIKPVEAHQVVRAEELWVRASQMETFAEDLVNLKNKQGPSKGDRLAKLAVRLNEKEIIVIDSRISVTKDVTKSQKEPAVLSGDSAYTKLYLKRIHVELLHSGTETVVNEVRQHYHILKIRPTVKSVIKQCLKCRMKRAMPPQPRTGNHPAGRVAHHERPFTYTGLDYFGPLSVTVGRQHQKRYVALFTCLTTRAIHLEIANNLSADSLISALRRMTARRGCPAEIYSDNGTNMHGADKELRKALEDEASNKAIKWTYLPPAAPFMGGAWERLVRSVKTALSFVLLEKHPHEETLATLLCEVEYVVNSRPLTHVSVEAEDEEALTPNHILMGGSGRVPTPGTFREEDINNKQQWRRAQILADHFWKRWVKEYLPDLQYRREPHSSGPVIQIGDIVLIVDPNLPRNTWPRGRVIKLYPGKDGVVRVADIQTQGGLMKRPVKRLVIIHTETKSIVAP